MASAPGCVVTLKDVPLIVSSVACFIAFITYGAAAGSLGAALPELALHYNQTVSNFGIAFTARGIGYMIGTLASAGIMEYPATAHVSKTLLTCFSISVTGTSTWIITTIDNYHIALLFFFIQGLGFGGIDTCANCAIQDLWDKRVGPWMQSLHSFFGIGAVIGPTLCGAFGFKQTFILLGVMSFAPFIIIGLFSLFQKWSGVSNMTNDNDDKDEYEGFLLPEDSVQSTSQHIANLPQSEAKAPLVIRLLITAFFFFYVGSETGFGGWLATYLLDKKVVATRDVAAFAVSYFWGALATGRVVAIFLAIVLSNTTMLRLQLLITAVASICVFLFLSSSYNSAVGSAIAYGYGLSSIFPLAMTLINDYGFSMDSTTTTLFVVGSTFGEAIIPIVIGQAMKYGGSDYLPYSVTILTSLLLGLYIIVHILAKFSSTLNSNVTIELKSMAVDDQLSDDEF